jgi:uncharacterized protein
MRPRCFDPLHLDVEVFAKENCELQGEWPLTSLNRLSEAAHPDAAPAANAEVLWKARGESRAVRGGSRETWLHVDAETTLDLVCQRCLGPLPTRLHVQRAFLFAPDESTAAELDAESEDDVLAMTRSLDLRGLVEDELLLALPLVPRHDVCAEPLPLPEDDDEPIPERANPFAALSALKRQRPTN